MNKDIKEYIVFSQRMAGYLMMNGFVLKRLDLTNKDNKKRNIFIFNNSPNLLEYVESYKLESK